MSRQFARDTDDVGRREQNSTKHRKQTNHCNVQVSIERERERDSKTEREGRRV